MATEGRPGVAQRESTVRFSMAAVRETPRYM